MFLHRTFAQSVSSDDSSRQAAHSVTVAAVVAAAAARLSVAVHHPPHFMCEQSHCGLSQSTDLIEAVQGTSVRVVTSGHVHDDFSHQIGPILFATGPSTCIGFDHNPAGHRASSLTPGALVYDLRQMG